MAESTPNTEMTLIVDLDYEKLNRLHLEGSVRNLQDRRADLYSIKWRGRALIGCFFVTFFNYVTLRSGETIHLQHETHSRTTSHHGGRLRPSGECRFLRRGSRAAISQNDGQFR